MLALAFSLALFLTWTAVGRALLAATTPRLGVLRAWLLAPGAGLAVFLLGLMAANQLGWPLARVAWPLTLTGLAGAAVVWRWRRPRFPARALAPFAGAALVSLLWTGWPALEAGFRWISYGNDDMANYCLAAERFAGGGFYQAPTLADLGGRDYAAYYFFMHVADMMRFGAEHILAWSASLAGLKATQAFMPTILALALTQLLAAAGLVLQGGRHRRLAMYTAWVLAISPLFMLGTLYQLIAQVGGLALLLVTLALMTRTNATVSRRRLIQASLPAAVTGSALCIYYPEATPFAVLSYLAYQGLGTVRRRTTAGAAVALTAYTLIGVLILLRFNLISYLSVLVMQFSSAVSSANLLLSLFPYFMIPTGFANLFGLMPIARDFPEPVLTLSVVVGMALAATLLWRAVRGAWRMQVASLLLAVQVLLAIQLYRAGNDFGLYKLAMFMQPALAAGVAGLILAVSRERRTAAVLLTAVLAAATGPTAWSYSRASQGSQAGGLTELRFASRVGLGIQPPADPDAQITAGIENVVAAKFAASELRGRQVAFASRDYFFPSTRYDFDDPPSSVRWHPHFEEMARAKPLVLGRNARQVSTAMLWQTEFSQPVLARPTDYYLGMTGALSLFNKLGRTAGGQVEQVFTLEPAREVRNQLLFVHSGRGNHYYLGDRRRIAFFQQEADVFAPGHEFNGLGRFLLLRVEHPSPEIYLRVAATRSALPGRKEWKAEAVVHAEEDRPLGAIGAGAFNLFVGPLKPVRFQGASYVAIDFQEIPQTVADPRRGIKALYNRDIPLDYRRLLGWGRDISALSVEEYQRFPRPTRISRFPADLVEAAGLEFSGAYEDGWVSPKSKYVLGAAPAGAVLRLRGMIPELPGSALGTGTMTVQVGGRSWELPARTGGFDWLIPVAGTAGTTPVGLAFSAHAALPDGDERPAAARLELLEVLPGPGARAYDYATAGATRPAGRGIDQDGWIERQATIELPAMASGGEVLLRIEFPGWTPLKEGQLNVALAGEIRPPQVLPAGETILRIRYGPANGPRTLQLSSDRAFKLPGADGRERTGRLRQLEIVPDA